MIFTVHRVHIVYYHYSKERAQRLGKIVDIGPTEVTNQIQTCLL